MIMEPCVALKKKHMYLSHCLHELLQFYRPQSRLGQPEMWFCVYFFSFFFFLLKVLFHRGCCQNKSIASNLGWTAAYSIKGRAVWFRGTPPPSASWLWGDPAPQSPCPLACLQMGLQQWGWAVRPWRINQKALLARVFSSILCLCVYPNALEDYLCWLGLWICRSGWVMLEWFGWL